ncbi:hypothetical protein [Streptomyces sp. NPDC018031]|uniref:TRADD-N-associated membrane domain-containing protein n=1 Tax=Streptomyces sp. NPDC018031 TaxID=3365033 RepID=UPI0037BB2C8D
MAAERPFEASRPFGDDQIQPHRHRHRPHHVVISGGSVVKVVGGAEAPLPPPGPQVPDPRVSEREPEDPADRRQTFFFDFLGQALGQARTSFRLSALFMSAGAVLVLVGGALALAGANDPNAGYLPVLTSLAGAVITSCGGAFALHANRARRHLTAQAERVHEGMRADLTLGQTLGLIDRVDDPDLRDRLKSVAALRALGLGPDPDTVASRLLPLIGEGGPFGAADRPGGALEPGGPAATDPRKR